MGRGTAPFLRIQRRQVGPNSAVIWILFGTAFPFQPRSNHVFHPEEQGSQSNASAGEFGVRNQDFLQVIAGLSHISRSMYASASLNRRSRKPGRTSTAAAYSVAASSGRPAAM